MKVGITAPTPGIRPSRKPTAVPRPIAPPERFHSSALGHRPLEFCFYHPAKGSLHHQQDLGHAEESHHHRHEAQAVVELRDAEGEARRAAHRVDADQREQQAEHGHQQRRSERLAGEPGHQAQAEEHQGEEFRRPEGERKTRERRRHHHQGKRGEHAADEGADRRHAECGSRPALARHLVAVEAGDHRRRLARHVDQHRGNGAAVHRAVVDRGQHDDGAGRIQREGERDQDRGPCRWAEAGQHADQRAEDATGEREGEVRRRQRRREP